MLLLVITALLSAAPVDVDVTMLDDRAYHGQLKAITDDALVVQVESEEQSLPLAKLLSVLPTKPPAALPLTTNIFVELIDGTRLPSAEFAVRAGKAIMTLAGGEKLELPVMQLRQVRLLAQDDAVRKLWNDVVAAKITGDAVVVRKGGDGKPVVLDYLEGAVGDVGDASIAFQVDGDAINVNRQKVKVEGIIFYRPTTSAAADALCRVEDVRGAVWSAKSLALAGDNLELTTASGISHTLPLADIAQLDFSLDKIVYLSDIEPLKAEWQPFLASTNLSAAARQLFGLRRDKNFAGKPLALGETKFRKGLALHSRSEVAYRLPGEFSRLVASVGIDPAQRSRGNVRLEIRGDDRVLLDEPLAGSAAPRPIELDVTGVGRLTILVDYGEGLDIGDQLILGNARLIR